MRTPLFFSVEFVEHLKINCIMKNDSRDGMERPIGCMARIVGVVLVFITIALCELLQQEFGILPVFLYASGVVFVIWGWNR